MKGSQAFHVRENDPLPNFGEYPTQDPVNGLFIQPGVYQPGEAPYLPPEVRPPINRQVILSYVKSGTFFKRRKVARFSREEWNRHLLGKWTEIEATGRASLAATPSLVWRVRYHTSMNFLCGTFETFRRWTVGAVSKLHLFQWIGCLLLAASFVGTYKLYATQVAFADAPIVCGIIAAIVALSVFGVKGMIEKFDVSATRRRLRITLNLSTLVLLMIYCALLAFQTGGLASGVQDVLLLGQGETAFGKPWLSPYLQMVQLWLEAIAALSCFENAESLRERYGEPDRTMSAVKLLRVQQAHEMEMSLLRHRNTVAWARGCVRRLRSDRDTYVIESLGVFGEELENRRVHRLGMSRARGAEEASPSLFERIKDFFLG